MFPVLLAALLLAAGCQAPDTTGSAPADNTPASRAAGEITPASPAYARWRAQAKGPSGARTNHEIVTEGDILELPKYVVKEKGFVDFGFSIITNEEVLRGKPVKWVQVGVVLPDSIAERGKLTTGTKIVAIDDQPVTDLYRDDLQFLLFERESHEQVRLLVLSRKFGLLPMFIELSGNPPASEE